MQDNNPLDTVGSAITPTRIAPEDFHPLAFVDPATKEGATLLTKKVKSEKRIRSHTKIKHEKGGDIKLDKKFKSSKTKFKYTLDFPPYALQSDTEVEMALPNEHMALFKVDFNPHGTQFDRPVSLSFDCTIDLNKAIEGGIDVTPLLEELGDIDVISELDDFEVEDPDDPVAQTIKIKSEELTTFDVYYFNDDIGMWEGQSTTAKVKLVVTKKGEVYLQIKAKAKLDHFSRYALGGDSSLINKLLYEYVPGYENSYDVGQYYTYYY